MKKKLIQNKTKKNTGLRQSNPREELFDEELIRRAILGMPQEGSL